MNSKTLILCLTVWLLTLLLTFQSWFVLLFCGIVGIPLLYLLERSHKKSFRITWIIIFCGMGFWFSIYLGIIVLICSCVPKYWKAGVIVLCGGMLYVNYPILRLSNTTILETRIVRDNVAFETYSKLSIERPTILGYALKYVSPKADNSYLNNYLLKSRPVEWNPTTLYSAYRKGSSFVLGFNNEKIFVAKYTDEPDTR